MKYIARDIEVILKGALKYFSVITLTGPRQSVKTTTLRHVFPDYKYFSLENPAIRNFADNDPVALLNQNEGGMMLDEVQNSPQLLSYIQGIVDEHPDKKFVLSGSSNFALLRSITQSLAGRTGVY